jgi:hypothetical protein
MEEITIMKNERLRQSLRQTDFGISQPHLSLIENRRIFVGRIRAERIAKVLKMSREELFHDGFARLITETV